MIRRLWYLALGALAAWAWARVRNARPYMVEARVAFPAALLPPGVTAIGVQIGAVAGDDDDDADGDGDGLPGLDPGIWGQS